MLSLPLRLCLCQLCTDSAAELAQEAANRGQEFETTGQALIAAFLAAEEDICGMQALDASNSGTTATLLLLQVGS